MKTYTLETLPQDLSLVEKLDAPDRKIMLSDYPNLVWTNSSVIVDAALDKLEYIGGSAGFENSKITSLGKLEFIGGFADFRNSQVTDLGKLKGVGGDIYTDFSSEKLNKMIKKLKFMVRN